MDYSTDSGARYLESSSYGQRINFHDSQKKSKNRTNYANLTNREAQGLQRRQFIHVAKENQAQIAPDYQKGQFVKERQKSQNSANNAQRSSRGSSSIEMVRNTARLGASKGSECPKPVKMQNKSYLRNRENQANLGTDKVIEERSRYGMEPQNLKALVESSYKVYTKDHTFLAQNHSRGVRGDKNGEISYEQARRGLKHSRTAQFGPGEVQIGRKQLEESIQPKNYCHTLNTFSGINGSFFPHGCDVYPQKITQGPRSTQNSALLSSKSKINFSNFSRLSNSKHHTQPISSTEGHQEMIRRRLYQPQTAIYAEKFKQKDLAKFEGSWLGDSNQRQKEHRDETGRVVRGAGNSDGKSFAVETVRKQKNPQGLTGLNYAVSGASGIDRDQHRRQIRAKNMPDAGREASEAYWEPEKKILNFNQRRHLQPDKYTKIPENDVDYTSIPSRSRSHTAAKSQNPKIQKSEKQAFSSYQQQTSGTSVPSATAITPRKDPCTPPRPPSREIELSKTQTLASENSFYGANYVALKSISDNKSNKSPQNSCRSLSIRPKGFSGYKKGFGAEHKSGQNKDFLGRGGGFRDHESEHDKDMIGELRSKSCEKFKMSLSSQKSEYQKLDKNRRIYGAGDQIEDNQDGLERFQGLEGYREAQEVENGVGMKSLILKNNEVLEGYRTQKERLGKQMRSMIKPQTSIVSKNDPKMGINENPKIRNFRQNFEDSELRAVKNKIRDITGTQSRPLNQLQIRSDQFVDGLKQGLKKMILKKFGDTEPHSAAPAQHHKRSVALGMANNLPDPKNQPDFQKNRKLIFSRNHAPYAPNEVNYGNNQGLSIEENSFTPLISPEHSQILKKSKISNTPKSEFLGFEDNSDDNNQLLEVPLTSLREIDLKESASETVELQFSVSARNQKFEENMQNPSSEHAPGSLNECGLRSVSGLLKKASYFEANTVYGFSENFDSNEAKKPLQEVGDAVSEGYDSSSRLNTINEVPSSQETQKIPYSEIPQNPAVNRVKIPWKETEQPLIDPEIDFKPIKSPQPPKKASKPKFETFGKFDQKMHPGTSPDNLAAHLDSSIDFLSYPSSKRSKKHQFEAYIEKLNLTEKINEFVFDGYNDGSGDGREANSRGSGKIVRNLSDKETLYSDGTLTTTTTPGIVIEPKNGVIGVEEHREGALSARVWAENPKNDQKGKNFNHQFEPKFGQNGAVLDGRRQLEAQMGVFGQREPTFNPSFFFLKRFGEGSIRSLKIDFFLENHFDRGFKRSRKCQSILKLISTSRISTEVRRNQKLNFSHFPNF